MGVPSLSSFFPPFAETSGKRLLPKMARSLHGSIGDQEVVLMIHGETDEGLRAQEMSRIEPGMIEMGATSDMKIPYGGFVRTQFNQNQQEEQSRGYDKPDPDLNFNSISEGLGLDKGSNFSRVINLILT